MIMEVSSSNIQEIYNFIACAIKFIDLYRDIIDAYVSNFFAKDLWKLVKPQWREALSSMDTNELSDLLTKDSKDKRQVLPLSLICFKACTKTYSLRRTAINLDDVKLKYSPERSSSKQTMSGIGSECSAESTVVIESSFPVEVDTNQEPSKDNIRDGQYLPLNQCYRKHVKPKKQHEILQLGKLINTVCQTCLGNHVVDVGAGQGHLSRLLSFGHNLKVTTVEASGCHAPKAQKFDRDMSYTIRSHLKRKLNDNQKTDSTADCDNTFDENAPSHVTCMIQPDTTPDEFMNTINCKTHCTEQNQHKSDGNIQNPTSRLVLTGLHACGDLSPTILRVFARCPEIYGVCSVGCCYMKMTTNAQKMDGSNEVRDYGYPMSDFVSGLENSGLSYEAREMACHSADVYTQRLKENPPNLKLHCYRAMLQEIILHIQPDFEVGATKLTIKRAETMDFRSYARKALAKLGLEDNIEEEFWRTIEEKLTLWKDVVAFYTIRLSLAPVVETVILLDRMIYLQEQGIPSNLIPAFDPVLSPRNFALVALK